MGVEKRSAEDAAEGTPSEKVAKVQALQWPDLKTNLTHQDAWLTLNNGVRYPLLGFGTFKLDAKSTTTCTTSAIEMGYRLVDTAAVYENEKGLKPLLSVSKSNGKVWYQSRPKQSDMEPCDIVADYDQAKDCMVQTKLWTSKHGRSGCLATFNDSLKALGLLTKDRKTKTLVQSRPLDCYLIHYPGPKRGWPLKNKPDGKPGIMPEHWAGGKTRNETWAAMEDLYLEKRVRIIGVCNYSLRQLKELVENPDNRVVPHMVQMEYHPLLHEKGGMKELMEYCKEKNIMVQAYASLGGSEGLKQRNFSLTVDPRIVAIAKDAQRSAGQVLMRWALQKGTTVVPKSSKVERIKENTALFDFELTEAQMEAIGKLDRGQRLSWKGVDPDKEK